MKIRKSFVSNSSSSSFVVVGKWLINELKNIDENELEEKGIFCYTADESGPCIGIRFRMKDEETWGQYKKDVAKKLTDVGITSEPNEITICYGTFCC